MMSFLKLLTAFVAFIFFIITMENGHTKIISVDNFNDLKKEVVRHASKDSLVLFDIDDVLICSTDEFSFHNEIRKNFKKELSQHKSKKEIQKIFSDFFLKRQVQLVDKNIPLLLETLRAKKIPTTALSAWWTGDFGTIKEMEKQRLKDLSQVHISFSDISPFNQDVRFCSHETENGGVPMVISGIILTACADKGEILGLVLQHNKQKFKTIIFIDDQMKYLREVEAFCIKKGIDFLGIHYRDVALKEILEVDFDREKLRFDILKKEHIWLSDHELRERLYLSGQKQKVIDS